MNPDLGLKVLGEIMAWSDDRAREEYRWLRLMARLKYDGYRDFQAGMRFIESLVTWLQQFRASEREIAYSFVRNALVYIGPAEMERLAEQFYPQAVRERLLRIIAKEYGVPAYRILAMPEALEAVRCLRRQTLFMGLSDGARIDTLRHINVGVISNEQLVVATQVDTDKWQDLLGKLRSEQGDPGACFRLVYLIDDFMGTGTSFLRFDESEDRWSGKLVRFKESISGAVDALRQKDDRLFSRDWQLCVHHYIGSFVAARDIASRVEKAHDSLTAEDWATSVHFTFGMTLPEDLPIDAVPGRFDKFVELTRTNYDPSIRTPHTDVGGVEHLGLGYGGCALPLVLEHNTPNNSVALLWAETDGGPSDGTTMPSMRPLFRRRQRHA